MGKPTGEQGAFNKFVFTSLANAEEHGSMPAKKPQGFLAFLSIS